MSTLLLRLAAPLQAWGAGAKFDRRETQRLPTKSGVVGLLAAALGRRRWESIEDLETLKMGVRADQAGEMLRDYHTAKREQHTYITQRYYIADAVFVVGLEGEEGLLSRLAEAVENPAFPLFLGRRSCPPQGKILINLLRDTALLEALAKTPWQASDWYKKKNAKTSHLQVLLEAPPGAPGAFYLRDAPLSYHQARRQHGFRSQRIESIRLPGEMPPDLRPDQDITEHDAMMNWGD